MSVNRRTAFKVAAGAALFPTIVSRAWAQEKQLHVGVYNSALGKIVQKDVIPEFEKAHKCRPISRPCAPRAPRRSSAS
jgi:putative spermidine/putrescine transport system substrate-binding protein